ncbi:MAG: cell division protein CrgA [Acidimicrobiales bacterium]
MARKAATRGRATEKSRTAPGRYTPPIPRQVRRSPRWYPWMLLTLLLLGVLFIVLNYIDALPKSPTNWYTLGGLICILAAALLSTRYR